jgi:hypothetical protein
MSGVKIYPTSFILPGTVIVVWGTKVIYEGPARGDWPKFAIAPGTLTLMHFTDKRILDQQVQNAPGVTNVLQ